MNTKTRAPSHRECLQMLDGMCDALHALHYLDTLLDVALNADGGILSDRFSGLHCLMKSQLEPLDDGVNALCAFIKYSERVEAEAPRSGLPAGMAMPPIYRPGMERDLCAEAAVRETADRLRGADLEAVARDTNLAEATVKRVVDRLLAEPLDDAESRRAAK